VGRRLAGVARRALGVLVVVNLGLEFGNADFEFHNAVVQGVVRRGT